MVKSIKSIDKVVMTSEDQVQVVKELNKIVQKFNI